MAGTDIEAREEARLAREAAREARAEALRREVLESAPGFILQTGIDGPWIDYMCRHHGYTSGKLSRLFPGKQSVVDFLLIRHAKLALEAVCGPWAWEGEPMDVLRAMSLALVGYGADHIERHRVFLAEYERGPQTRRALVAQQTTYLANDFQNALHAVLPSRTFRNLRSQAEILRGQLLHAPLWWPAEKLTSKATTLDAWVCTQLGLVTGLRRPDHRRAHGAVRRVTEQAG